METLVYLAASRSGDNSGIVTPEDALSETEAEAGEASTPARPKLTPAEAQENFRRLRLRAFLLCVYASVWGMGGHLVGESSRVACSDYFRQARLV